VAAAIPHNYCLAIASAWKTREIGLSLVNQPLALIVRNAQSALSALTNAQASAKATAKLIMTTQHSSISKISSVICLPLLLCTKEEWLVLRPPQRVQTHQSC
jgi:hypothetical protein